MHTAARPADLTVLPQLNLSKPKWHFSIHELLFGPCSALVYVNLTTLKLYNHLFYSSTILARGLTQRFVICNVVDERVVLRVGHRYIYKSHLDRYY